MVGIKVILTFWLYNYYKKLWLVSVGSMLVILMLCDAIGRVRNPKNQLLQINPPTIVGC